MKPRDIAFVALGTIFAATTIGLGFWQLSRLAERKELNKELRSRAETKPVGVQSLPADTGEAHFRRVKLSGKFDFAHEIVTTNRTRNGSPGVNIITPLMIAGTDTAVLVNRGWVYAPDGMTVDLARWREPDSLVGDGFVENFRSGPGPVKLPRRENAWRWLDRPALTRAFPYPISSYYVVLIGKPRGEGANVPPRLDVPPLDEGPHKSYALQWFSFAAISIIGTFLFVRRK